MCTSCGLDRHAYSNWPVILTVYNLPSWLCMPCPFLFLTLLIFDPVSPGQNIDVYFCLLVNDLKLLWEEVVQNWDSRLGKIFKCELFYYGLSMTSLHMTCYLDEACMGSLRVHIVWATQSHSTKVLNESVWLDCHREYLLPMLSGTQI